MFKRTKNLQAVRTAEIPLLAFGDFRSALSALINEGKRLIAFFGVPEKTGGITIYAAAACDADSSILTARSVVKNGFSYESLTPQAEAFAPYEREIWEETGITPVGHPRLEPVRYSHDRSDKSKNQDNRAFCRVEGEQVHEVAVGPVHAGVIEPGHFRFMCAGEKILTLETALGYQHRNVEKLFLQKPGTYMPQLSETVCGDTTAAHASAYCRLMECLSGTKVSRRAEIIRAIGLELERAAMHAFGLAALSGDIAYLLGNAVFGVNRTTLINTSLMICGSRFSRGLLRPGGVAFDIDDEKAGKVIRNTLDAVKKISQMAEKMFASASVLSRLQRTGTVARGLALKAGITGFAARASGVSVDSREDHPCGAYREYPVRKLTMEEGDVFARAYLRYMEIRQSAQLIYEMAANMPSGDIITPAKPLIPGMAAFSMCEGWRGEVVYAAITDDSGKLKKIKIKDPSFNNWVALELSVRNNGISDFPLCNKSFDLSYCGNDL